MFIVTFLEFLKEATLHFFRNQPVLGPLSLLFIEEMGVPLPIPGDIDISYIGYQITKGVISYEAAFVLLLLTILAGSSVLYFISYYYGKKFVDRVGKYIHLNKRKLLFIEKKFKKYGPLVIIIGRHIPGFRIPVTVFAGLSKVTYKTFILSELISVIIWIAVFIQIGEQLGRRTLLMIHNHNTLIFIIGIPVLLTIITFGFGKFIPEEKTKTH